MVATAAARRDVPLVALITARDAETRRLYAEFLALSDCRTEQAEDGREALAKVFSRQPDVVVTETHLPGINGFDLCALLRQDSATRGIPILLVAGETFDADLERGETVGADAVLAEPCHPATLFAEIQRLVQLSGDVRERSRAARRLQPARSIRSSARPFAHQAPDAEQRALAPRHDQSADRAAAPQLSGMPPAAALHAQPHRRRDRAEL
jgi:CheY-like chemotaxis protein